MTDVKAELDALVREYWHGGRDISLTDVAQRAASIGARGEREECAKVCDAETVKRRARSKKPYPGDEHIPPFTNDMVQISMSLTADGLANQIRARSQDPESRPKPICTSYRSMNLRGLCIDCGHSYEQHFITADHALKTPELNPFDKPLTVAPKVIVAAVLRELSNTLPSPFWDLSIIQLRQRADALEGNT